MKSLFAKYDKRHFKKKELTVVRCSPHIARSEPETRLVKKAVIVHFQDIVSSRFTAEAVKRLVVFEQKTISPF